MADLEALALEVTRCRDRLHSIEATLTANTLLQTHMATLMSTLQEDVTEALQRTERLARADEIAAAVRLRLLSLPVKIVGALLSLTLAAGAVKGLVG